MNEVQPLTRSVGDAARRQSGIELLRIIAMLMILAVHFDGAALGLPEPNAIWSTADWVKTVVESLAIIGVNLFVLISGYFGIRLTWRRIFTFLAVCAFYSVGIYLLVCIIKPAKFKPEATVDALLLVSHNDLWFVRDYFFLMLLTPLINPGLAALDDRKLLLLTGAVLLISCYFGWLWHGAVNPTGYCLMQMVTMYVIGSALRRFKGTIPMSYATVAYVAGTAGIILSAVDIPASMAYAYNSPFVIMAAAGLFLIFTRLRFHSPAVNSVAGCTFAVYLIHKNPYIWGGYLKPTVIWMWNDMDGILFAYSIVGFTLAVFAVCIMTDMGRKALFDLLRYGSDNVLLRGKKLFCR